MSILSKLKTRNRPLVAAPVPTPELAEVVNDVEVDSVQYLAELDGAEMDSFVSIWASIRDKHLDDEDSTVQDFKRAAVSFCWCDSERSLHHRAEADVWECIKALRAQPATLVARMFSVANGLNAFVGVDDETKKNLLVKMQKAKSADGSGAKP
jgi:Mg/Co/Ni transporter MgtE